jgi:hypothetical protein
MELRDASRLSWNGLVDSALPLADRAGGAGAPSAGVVELAAFSGRPVRRANLVAGRSAS